MIVDLGAADELVAVGRFDPAAPADLPVVGSLVDIDYERLVALRPTHVFLQPQRADGVPNLLTQLAAEHGWRVLGVQIDTIDDVVRVLHNPDDPGACVGGLLDRMDDAAHLAQALRDRMNALRESTARLERPRTLLVFRTQPLGVFGRGSFLDEVLDAAGGTNAVEGAAYLTIDREMLLSLQPEAVVLLSSGDDFDDAEVRRWVQRMQSLQIPAAEDSVRVLVDPLAKLPSTSIWRVAEELAAVLHGPGVVEAAAAQP